ncbi:hypothetical protein V6Z11_D13G192300 [Gossypium hirsutum]
MGFLVSFPHVKIMEIQRTHLAALLKIRNPRVSLSILGLCIRAFVCFGLGLVAHL